MFVPSSWPFPAIQSLWVKSWIYISLPNLGPYFWLPLAIPAGPLHLEILQTFQNPASSASTLWEANTYLSFKTQFSSNQADLLPLFHQYWGTFLLVFIIFWLLYCLPSTIIICLCVYLTLLECGPSIDRDCISLISVFPASSRVLAYKRYLTNAWQINIQTKR